MYLGLHGHTQQIHIVHVYRYIITYVYVYVTGFAKTWNNPAELKSKNWLNMKATFLHHPGTPMRELQITRSAFTGIISVTL